MQTSSLRFLFTSFLLFLVTVFTGCDQERDGDIRIAAGKGGGLLAVMQMNMYGKAEFVRLSEFRLNEQTGLVDLTPAGKYRGELSGLVRESESSYLLVFSDGAVFRFIGGKLEPLGEGRERVKLISAAGEGRTLYGVALDTANSTAQLLEYNFNTNKWDFFGKVIPDPQAIGIAEVTLENGVPCVFWRNISAGVLNAGIRGAFYKNGAWVFIDNPRQALTSGAFTVSGGSDGLMLWQAPAQYETTGSTLSFYSTGSKKGWYSFSPSVFSASGEVGVNALASAFSGGRFWVCRLGTDGIKFAYTDKVESGNWILASSGLGAADSVIPVWLIPAIAFFTALIVFRILRIRMMRALARSGKTELVRIQPVPALASLIDRGVAMLVDLTLLFPLPYIFVVESGLSSPQAILQRPGQMLFAYFLWLGGYAFYATVCEFIWGQTVGKFVFNLKVRCSSGGRPSLFQIILRNVMRFADFFPVSFGGTSLFGIVAILSVSFSRKRQRLGDIFARTVVKRVVPLNKRNVILASASPRRQEILAALGIDFKVKPADVDEVILSGVEPREMVERIASDKAQAVSAISGPDALVIAADTAVVCDGEILGKPDDHEHARQMLEMLSGVTHEVITAITIIDNATGQFLEGSDMTQVRMRKLSSTDIQNYLDSGEPFDKAGSYAIQGRGGEFVEHTEGSISNVIGFPVELLREMLKDLY